MTNVLVVYCHVTNYFKTYRFKTTIKNYLTQFLSQKFGSYYSGIMAQKLLCCCSHHVSGEASHEWITHMAIGRRPQLFPTKTSLYEHLSNPFAK
jgi:hypothetical protein